MHALSYTGYTAYVCEVVHTSRNCDRGGCPSLGRRLPDVYWSSQASSKRQPLKMLLTITVIPCTRG